jgi:hypothetical protein
MTLQQRKLSQVDLINGDDSVDLQILNVRSHLVEGQCLLIVFAFDCVEHFVFSTNCVTEFYSISTL